MPRSAVDRVHEVYATSYRRLVGQLTGVTGDPVEAEDAVMEAFARAVGSGRSSRRPNPHPAPSSFQVEHVKSRRTTSSDTQAATADETILIMDRVPSFVADRPPPIVNDDNERAGYCTSAIRIANELEDYPHATMRPFAQPNDSLAAATFATSARSAFRPAPVAASTRSTSRSRSALNRGGFRGVPNQDQGMWI